MGEMATKTFIDCLINNYEQDCGQENTLINSFYYQFEPGNRKQTDIDPFFCVINSHKVIGRRKRPGFLPQKVPGYAMFL